MIRLPDRTTCCHILFEMLISYLSSDFRDLRCMSLANFLKITERTVGKMWFAQDEKYSLTRTKNFSSNKLTGLVMSWWQLATLIICVGFQSRDVSYLEILSSEVEWTTICQGRGMSWWQLSTLIICVCF